MHQVKSDYLFVYSSLLKGFALPDYEYITRYFDFVEPAKVRGILSIKNDIVVGTPVLEDQFIQGELYVIKQPELFSFAIGQLDEYEGVHPEPPEEPDYRRDRTFATTPDGKVYAAWIYWYTGKVEDLPVIPSGDMLEFLKDKK